MTITISPEVADKLLSTIKIPPRPAVILELEKEQSKEDPDLRRIVQIIAKDIALTAALLKTANSPYFGLSNKVQSVQQAVMTLGLNNAISIANGIAIKNSLSSKDRKLDRFWDSAEKVAEVSAFISTLVPGVPKETAYMYGLFRDCGIPLMLQKFPDYTQTLMKADTRSKLDFTKIEDDLHDINHATLGYLLAKSWCLPNVICQAMLNHHDISILNSDEQLPAVIRGLIAVVRFAEYLCDVRQMRDDYDWNESGPIVLSYLGIADDEFQDIKENVFGYMCEEA